MRKDVIFVILLFILVGVASYFLGGFEQAGYQNYSWFQIIAMAISLISGKKEEELAIRDYQLGSEYEYTERSRKQANLYTVGSVIIPLVVFIILLLIVFSSKTNGKG